MISVSDLFKRYVTAPDRIFEIKADIGAVTYLNDSIIECDVEGNFASSGTFSIGEIAIQKLVLSIKTKDTIQANS
jgi:hypothetical protein